MKTTIKKFIISGIAVSCFIAITSLVVSMYSKSYIYSDIVQLPHAETALIPGASVSQDGVLSPVLQDRADTAVTLYKKGKVENILVSGDNGTTTYNEVNPVHDYLILKGVKEQDIYLDYAGFDTYSTLYRARDIFLVDSITIVTQSFHLPRAIFLAQNLGVDANGFSADHGHYLFKNTVREWLANVKAIFNLLLHTKPKYLGETVPVM